jgi:hypothetical protein
LYNPAGVAIDTMGNVYIADDNNDRIRKVGTSRTTTPYFSIASIAGDTICMGTTVMIYSTSSSGVASYRWLVDGTVVTDSSSSYSYTPIGGDSVLCIFIDTSLCGSDSIISNKIHFVVDSAIVPTISLSGLTFASIGSIVTVNAIIGGSDSVYTIHWYDNGVFFASTTTPTVTYIKTSTIDSITASIIPEGFVCYDTTLSGLHIVIDSTTEVNNILNNSYPSITIFPNPGKSILTIISQNPIYTILIINMLGQIVYTQSSCSDKVQINVADLPAGLYFIKVNEIESRKFLKE